MTVMAPMTNGVHTSMNTEGTKENSCIRQLDLFTSARGSSPIDIDGEVEESWKHQRRTVNTPLTNPIHRVTVASGSRDAILGLFRVLLPSTATEISGTRSTRRWRKPSNTLQSTLLFRLRNIPFCPRFISARCFENAVVRNCRVSDATGSLLRPQKTIFYLIH